MENALKDLRRQVKQQWDHINMCRATMERMAEMFQTYIHLHAVEHEENQESINQELVMLQRVYEHQEELLHYEVNMLHEQITALRQRRPKVND